MDKLEPPSPFSFDGNVSHGWKKWSKHFDFFLTATESDGKPDKVKTSILLSCIGPKGRDIYETFQFSTEGDKLKLKPVLEKFAEYCNPRKNITIIRHQFFTYRQQEGQSFNEFVTELKRRSFECEFATLQDSLIRDMIVCGVADPSLRERLLRDAELTLEKAVAAGHAAEETRRHAKELRSYQDNIDIHNVNRRMRKEQRKYDTDRQSKYENDLIKKCKFCNSTHPRGKCPAYGKKCRSCKRKNHFEICCPHREVKAIAEKSDDFYDDDSCSEVSSSNDEFFIDSISDENLSNSANSKRISAVDDGKSDWSVALEMNGNNTLFKIDTGAQCNVFPRNLLKKLSPRPKLKPATVKLSAYNGTEIPVAGKCITSIRHKSKTVNVLFIVVETGSVPILGLNTSEKLNLIKRIYTINDTSQADVPFEKEFSDCFGKIGCLERTHHIEVKEDVKPVISPIRKIPLALKSRLKEELERMIKLDVIEPVEKPTDWVNALVVVSKPNGKLRICLDPRPLNKAIKRQHHKFPTAEEIISEMSGAQFFTKLDASNGYWQIKVDDESAALLTFGTPFGRYRFKRLPFGVHSASEVFQVEVANIIAGIEGCANSQDDIIVWGASKQEHDQRVRACLTRIRKSGLKLNQGKCIFASKSLTFLGHTVSADGLKPDPTKINAIIDMPIPKTKTDLQRFLGMINYLAKFVPNLSQITAPLRNLLKKDIQFCLQKPQFDAIAELKRLVTTSPCLKFFDPNLPTRLKPDASSQGLGALLEQNHGSEHEEKWHPIAYASRALQPYETRYAQIEKEVLSVVFGTERFHEYLYGRHFTVYNDHQPLKSIFSKSIIDCPPRIQRFFLKLQKYDFNLEYSPGRTMVVSDALSRTYLDSQTTEIQEPDLIHQINSTFQLLPISKNRLALLQEETASDEVLQQLINFTLHGWPAKHNIPHVVKPYYSIRSEIVYHEGLLLKGQRIIVPSSLRSTMKKIVHQGHNGMERCKSRARQSLYWPGMNAEIEELVARCSYCLTYRNKQQSEHLIAHEIPNSPWIKVASDVFHLFGRHYVIVTDYYSGYIEIERISDTTSPSVISKLKKIFARHGIPQELFSDNGPEYIANEFTCFSREWDFKHTTSSPYFAQSNGLVERSIQTVKRALKKAKDAAEDPYLALLILNTIPGSDGISPAMRLFNRHPRTTLPSLLQHPPPAVSSKRAERLNNRKTKDLPSIRPGSVVRMRINGDKDWRKK
eukprot:gene14552-16054_t